MAPTLQEKINSINERLRLFGIEAVHPVNQNNRQGRQGHRLGEIRLPVAARNHKRPDSQ
jgi:hypothetical protein